MAPIRWKSVGAANATDSRPSSRNSMSRPASRQSARLARTSSSGGVGTPMVDEREVTETVAADVSPKKLSQSIKVEIKVENEVRLTRTGRAVRTASQIAKGKYVESDDDSESVTDDSADQDFVDEADLSDLQVDTPTPINDEDSDDDIYGEQVPVASTSKATPVTKKRKLAKSFATPVSVNSKTSAHSSIFSPVDSVDTPASSLAGSIRKVQSALRGVKRKLEISVKEDEQEEEDEEESEFELDEQDEEDDALSIAPAVSSEEVYVQQTFASHRVQRSVGRARPGRARRWAWPRLTQWEKTNMQLCAHHPELACIWTELETAPLITPVQVPQPAGLSLQLLPFQLEGLDWLLKQEKQTRFGGGILADEMGMGKTIQTIALLLAEPRGKPNLVVAPTVALMQWKNEIEQHTNNGLSVCLFYGTNRAITAQQMKDYDVVLTTYAVLESVFRKQNTGFKRVDGIHKERSLLHSVEFFRVILDEAHNIKDRACNTAKAAFALKTKRKLCLSGTPLQNRIGELFSLLRFLQADPFAYYFCKKCECKELHWNFSDKRHCDHCGHKPMDHTCWFNTEFLKPIQRFGAEGEGLTAFQKLYTLLKRIMLRRTKVERADDLGLPSRVVTIRRDLFNEEEEDLYESIYGDAKRKFNTYVAQDVVLNNYANIFQLITRMRQMADHPDLVLKKHQDAGTFVCRLCDDEAQDAIRSKCHHVFCRMCVQEYIDGAIGAENPVCPVCSVVLNIDLSAPALDVVDEDAFKRGSIVNRIDMSTWRSSTKIEALVEELWKLRSRDCTIKSIVFSQFTSFLDLIQWRLSRAGFNTVKLDGHMTPAARAATIKRFSEDPEITVFLVSLKAGGVALNLTEASQVFIMDPWYNPAVEWQSGDRVHRIGQTRPVRITRLVIENSIESRIVELQAKKAQMINATIDYDDSALSQLTPSDLEFLFSS